MTAPKVDAYTPWLIFFEDQDVRPEIFTDEAAARERHKQCLLSYSCHLFALAPPSSSPAVPQEGGTPRALLDQLGRLIHFDSYPESVTACVEKLRAALLASEAALAHHLDYAAGAYERAEAAEAARRGVEQDVEQLSADLNLASADCRRFAWLCDDHPDKAVREQRKEILRRMSVMSYSAACMSIDAALSQSQEPTGGEG